MTYADDNRPDVEINYPSGSSFLSLKYAQPDIKVNSSARFVTHNPIGDVSVRQKLGEDPDEISIEGHCTEDEATQIDNLVSFEIVEVVSSRWEGTAQVASTSTRPITSGGGIDKNQEWVHQFTIELVEIQEGKFDYENDPVSNRDGPYYS